MIPAVAQTLAELLANGTSLIRTEDINFDHPSRQQPAPPRLNLYCYDLRESLHIRYQQQCMSDRGVSGRVNGVSGATPGSLTGSFAENITENIALLWFDVSFLVSAWDRTALGEQRLLSEALRSLLGHPFLAEEHLAPELRGHGNLSLMISTVPPRETANLWQALGVPLRPALYVTVTIPFLLQGASQKVLSAEY